MDRLTAEYRGYTIAVTPIKDEGDQWDFNYVLSKDGAPEPARLSGSQTLGGYAGPEVACLAGMEVAKIEVDNLLALQDK